jgi:hypothetical protein
VTPPAGAPEPSVPAPRRLPRWTDVAALAVGLGLLVYVLSRFPLGPVWQACLHAGPLVLLTPLIAIGWIVFNTVAMRVLLDGRVPFGALLHNRLVGDGYNMLLPLAGLGGEPWKVRHLSTFVPTQVAVAALIRDRVIENAVGFVITAIVIGVGLGHYHLPAPLRTALVAYVVVALVCALLSAAVVVTHLPGKAGTLVAKWLGGSDEPAPGPLPLRQFARVAFWNFLGRVLGSCEVAVLLYALAGRATLSETAFIDCVNNATGFIGFLIPQGIGVNEGSTVYVLGALGYAGPIALAFALVRRGRMLAVSLLGVLLHLARRRTTRPAR